MAVALPDHAARRTWSAVLDRARVELPETTFLMWFTDVRPIRLEGEVLTLAVPSGFVRERLQHNHLSLIEESAADAFGRPIKIDMEVNEAIRHEEHAIVDLGPQAPASSFATVAAPERPRQAHQPAAAPGLPFPNYTFDAFVPGPSSRFAHAAAMAVAEAPPSTAYNPLFIYGGTGLGKTHLLVAIGHHIWRLSRDTRIKYVTSEQFVTEFIKAVRERQGDNFRHKFREVDILLVDDIQFLAKREETQTEFFHTFNHLHGAGHQIVIASDRPPHELSGLEDRLVSRFRWGLCVDVQPPDLETRIAILRNKVRGDGIVMTDPEVLTFIASRISTNIRELEGALTRVVAFSSLTGRAMTVELSQDVLKDVFPQGELAAVSIQRIQETVSDRFGLSLSELCGDRRSQNIVYPRQVAMYLSRELTDSSLPKIGKEFGGRDHTTVIHATSKIARLIKEDRSVYNLVQELTARIKQLR